MTIWLGIFLFIPHMLELETTYTPFHHSIRTFAYWGAIPFLGYAILYSIWNFAKAIGRYRKAQQEINRPPSEKIETTQSVGEKN